MGPLAPNTVKPSASSSSSEIVGHCLGLHTSTRAAHSHVGRVCLGAINVETRRDEAQKAAFRCRMKETLLVKMSLSSIPLARAAKFQPGLVVLVPASGPGVAGCFRAQASTSIPRDRVTDLIRASTT